MPIPGFDGYSVSPAGEIHGKRGRVLHPATDKDGYLRVTIRKVYRGPGVGLYVHRAVLLAFVGPCPDGMQACHNNGVPSDNRVENLRWDTVRNNSLDRGRHGTALVGERAPRSVLSDEDANKIRAAFAAGERQCHLARRFGVNPGVVYSIVHNKSRRGGEFGTTPRPTPKGQALRKLSSADVADMRNARKAGESFSSLARTFGVSIGTAWCAVRGNTWKSVPDPVADTTQGTSRTA